MGSRQQTEGERARLPQLSRRAMLVGTSAAASGAGASAPLGAGAHPFTDPTRLYKHWVALDREVERLLLRWGDVEGWLIGEHNWCRLSEAEQAVLPEAQVLREVDELLKRVMGARDSLLDKLPSRGATTLNAVAARLGVVERLLYWEDHPEAHAMIVGSRRDLTAILAGARPWNGLS